MAEWQLVSVLAGDGLSAAGNMITKRYPQELCLSRRRAHQRTTSRRQTLSDL